MSRMPIPIHQLGHKQGVGGCCDDDEPHEHADGVHADHEHRHGCCDDQHADGGGSRVLSDLPPPSRVAELSLPLEYSRAELLFHHIEDGSGECEDHSVPRHVNDALAAFTNCASIIRREAIFSDNEIVEDMNTEDLKYLLVEVYIAALQSKVMEGRVGHLKAAKSGFEAYIDRVLRLGIITKAEKDALGLDAEKKPTGNELRQQKIERFKRNAAAKKRLAELAMVNKRKADEERRQGGQVDGVGSAASGPDEEVQREITLLTIAIACRTAADEIAAINQELPILEHAAKVAEREAQSGRNVDHGPRGRRTAGPTAAGAGGNWAGDDDDERASGPPANDMSIRPDRPGLEVTRIDPTYTISKETVKADVFKSGHRWVLVLFPSSRLMFRCPH